MSENLPIDSDVDLHQTRPSGHRRDDATMLATIAAGGAAGAAARYLIGQSWPTPTGAFPASTLAINVRGFALIGVLMVLITEVWSPRWRSGSGLPQREGARSSGRAPSVSALSA